MTVGTTGFFLQGLGEGLQTGFQMGQQTKEWNWQKKEKERIQKEKDDVMEASSIFNKKLESYYADGTLSDDEKLQLNTAYMASGYNIQEVIKGTYDAAMKIDKDTEEHNLAYLKSYREWLGDYDPSSIPELYEYTKSQMIGEKGKAMFVAGDSLLKKKYEALQGQQPEGYNSPDELLKAHPGADWEFNASLRKYIVKQTEVIKPKEVGISDYNSAANYLKNYANSKMPDTDFYKVRDGMANKFGLDLSGMTRDSLKETIKPEAESAFEERLRIAEEGGATPAELYNMKIGKSNTPKTGTSPSVQDYLFNVDLGFGIVSGKDLNALTPQDKIDIANTHNTRKQFLNPEALQQVEAYLTGFGIDLNPPVTPIPTEVPLPAPEVNQPGPIQKGVNWLKELPGKAKEAITSKKDYTTMSEEELKKLALAGDALAYQEAKKRGYVK